MAKERIFLVNEHTGRSYEVVEVDKEAGILTLQGEISRFKHPFDKAALKAAGYTMERRPG